MDKQLPDYRIRMLAKKWLDGSSTPEERAEFMKWYNSRDDNEPIFVPGDLASDEEKHQSRILEAIEKRLANTEDKKYRVGLHPRRLWAAAAIICLLVLGIYFVRSHPPKVHTDKVALIQRNDIPAIGSKAILTLDNGTEIILDSNHRGKLASQGNSSVIKTGSNVIAYNTSAVSTHENVSPVSFNTLSTPRGGQFRLTLADGTHVWLNAASSIRYPTAFTGKERVVEITGEAYFEVAADVSHPFRVKVNRMQIEVLGTHFNVMAYNNEKYIQTTLLQGSVKVIQEDSHHSRVLRPGQQARVNNENGALTLVPEADMRQAIAWKDGVQYFRNADIETIMREVERWYDVDVIIRGKLPQRAFSGEIPRDASLAELLKLFEVNKIHFTIDAANKKLTVFP